ncbi:MAG: transcription elongation factor GreA [Clostridia bacterium]|jgi:transcription elongation factor GreA|nr:transcription elongation factor GreA [Clostridia bacterium]
MDEIFLTAEGKKQLEERLEFLKVHGRAEMAEKIRVAREFGDLSENAEYDIAKDEQAKMESEIIEIENKLRVGVVIAENVKSNKVTIGSTVRIKDLSCDEEMLYKIVGTHESNPMENRISNESALGKALIGKGEGEKALVKTPLGKEYTVQVLKIGEKK